MSLLIAIAFAATSAATPLADVLGVTHVDGKYRFTEGDFLNEGADAVLALGSRVIKLWFFQPERKYPFSSDWGEPGDLVALAQHRYYRAVFEKPFSTILLVVYSVGRPEHYFRRGMTEEERRDESAQFYALAKHLLTTYRGTGKTFVLQHWEGDWAIRGGFDPDVPLGEVEVRGMIDWLNARQAGVDRARAEVGQEGVAVYHAAEVNLVKQAMLEGKPGVTDLVLPQTTVDLVSYSAWDTERDPALFRKALDYIAAHTPDREPFGDRNVYVGEYGLPEMETSPEAVMRAVRNVVETALDWGAPYIVYWQLYCNEPKRLPVQRNQDARGFWLIRPDGSKSPVWFYLRDRIEEARID